MSIPVLKTLADETRRIAIAGSSLAPGDFRLKKLVDPLKKSGEKAPVFAKVADAVNKVVESDEQTSAQALLELSTLTNSILYTQGQIGAEGDLENLPEPAVTQPATRTSYRVLAPLIEALTTTGGGRERIIKDAHEQGVFQDFRLIEYAVGALNDVYPEIAEFVAEQVIPIYGASVAPRLREDLDPKGGRYHARRLKALYKVSPDEARDLGREMIDDATKEMKVAAIECLKGSEEDFELLAGLTKARAKDVRIAAYSALGSLANPEAIKLLRSLLSHKKHSIELARFLKDNPDEGIRDEILRLAEENYAVLTKTSSSKEEKETAAHQLYEFLHALEGRQDEASVAFVRKVLDSHGKIKHDSALAEAARVASGLKMEEVDKQLIKLGNKLGLGAFYHCVIAGARRLSPSEMFKRFGDDYEKKALREVLSQIMSGRHAYWGGYYWAYDSHVDHKWDKKWIDLAIKHDQQHVVLALYALKDKQAVKYLIDQVEKNRGRDYWILRDLVEKGAKESMKVLVKELNRNAKTRTWYMQEYVDLIGKLPAEFYPEMKKLCDENLKGETADTAAPGLYDLKRKYDKSQSA